jgi:hypothetical protein
MSRLRVQFAYGLASSPQGAKARLFAEHFEACTPPMDTRRFASCLATQHASLSTFRPDLLIGSSFGCAVVVALLHHGLWRGPALLLAQAASHYLPHIGLPTGVRVTLVHARQDEIVPIEQSRALAATGTPELVELIEVDDDHTLTRLVESGELIQLVVRAAAAQKRADEA